MLVKEMINAWKDTSAPYVKIVIDKIITVDMAVIHVLNVGKSGKLF